MGREGCRAPGQRCPGGSGAEDRGAARAPVVLCSAVSWSAVGVHLQSPAFGLLPAALGSALVSRSFEPSYYGKSSLEMHKSLQNTKRPNACTTGECGDSTATGIVPRDFAALPPGTCLRLAHSAMKIVRAGLWNAGSPTMSRATWTYSVAFGSDTSTDGGRITAFAPNDVYVFGKLDRFIAGSDHMADENVGALSRPF